MIQKFTYSTQEERERILQEQTSAGLRLVAEANLIDENYLIFTDEPYTPPQPSNDEILSQTVAQLTLENADLKAQVQTLAQTVAQLLLK